jgi:hypothetical protein
LGLKGLMESEEVILGAFSAPRHWLRLRYPEAVSVMENVDIYPNYTELR